MGQLKCAPAKASTDMPIVLCESMPSWILDKYTIACGIHVDSSVLLLPACPTSQLTA